MYAANSTQAPSASCCHDIHLHDIQFSVGRSIPKGDSDPCLDPTGLGPMDGMIYYDERKRACDKMSQGERAATPSCPPPEEELDWAWFGRQYDAIKSKYEDLEKNYCIPGFGDCGNLKNVDWKGSWRSLWGRVDTTDKPQPAAAQIDLPSLEDTSTKSSSVEHEPPAPRARPLAPKATHKLEPKTSAPHRLQLPSPIMIQKHVDVSSPSLHVE